MRRILHIVLYFTNAKDSTNSESLNKCEGLYKFKCIRRTRRILQIHMYLTTAKYSTTSNVFDKCKGFYKLECIRHMAKDFTNSNVLDTREGFD